MRCSVTLRGSRSTRVRCSAGLNRQYGLDRYESVDYRVVHEDGERGLEIDLRRKSWGPNFVRLGVSVENDFDGGAVGNAGARFLMTGVNSFDARTGSPMPRSARSRKLRDRVLPAAVARPYFFVAPQLRYEQQMRQVIEDGGASRATAVGTRKSRSRSAPSSRTGVR